jgi:mannose-6-phosphate isomerase-like protein (cupin superfamily)
MTAAEVDEEVPAPTIFKYVKPASDKSRVATLLARTDLAFMMVQVLREGGENRLHSHRHTDGFWMVLSGRVRFYTVGDEVVAELGPGEGIVTPRHYKYWFESVGTEDLEILLVEATDRPQRTTIEAFLEDRDYHNG